MKKPFDPTKSHTHYCSNWRCNKPVHCRAVNCEIPEQAECYECRQGWEVERFAVATSPNRDSGGHRKTWPGRDREAL